MGMNPKGEKMSNTKDNKSTLEEKEQRIGDYIQSLAAVEEAMEPFKEQKRALKANYVENGWLTKEEMRMAIKAYRFITGDIDIDRFQEVYENLSGKL